MSITTQDVHHVARLARLELAPQEVELYTDHLTRILGLMQRLGAIPTAQVSPMSHAVALQCPERPDRVVNDNQRSILLANAPEAEEGHFCVPKIIE